MLIFEALVFFIFGLIFGSFLNVCIHRLPRKQSIAFPGSHCPRCDAKIKPYDNIPLVSFLLLKGHCRSCGEKINWRYPLVELVTGLLFAGLSLKFGVSKEVIVSLFLVSLLVLISFIDIEFQLILNKITIPGLIVGGILSFQFSQMAIRDIGLGLVLGGGSLMAVAFLGKGLFGKESMGMGDVKMAAMIGVFIGAKGVILALFMGFVIAGIFSIIAMALKKMKRASYIPFGPFIAAGTVVYIFYGEQIINWYLTFSGLK